MTTEQMDEALDAIHDVAERLLDYDLPNEAAKDVELILSLARYKFDVRSLDERKQAVASTNSEVMRPPSQPHDPSG